MDSKWKKVAYIWIYHFIFYYNPLWLYKSELFNCDISHGEFLDLASDRCREGIFEDPISRYFEVCNLR